MRRITCVVLGETKISRGSLLPRIHQKEAKVENINGLYLRDPVLRRVKTCNKTSVNKLCIVKTNNRCHFKKYIVKSVD